MELLSFSEGFHANIHLKKNSGRRYARKSQFEDNTFDTKFHGSEFVDIFDISSCDPEPSSTMRASAELTSSVKLAIVERLLIGSKEFEVKGQIASTKKPSSLLAYGGAHRFGRLYWQPSSYAIAESDIQAQKHREVFQRALIALEAAFYEDYAARLDPNSRGGLESFMRQYPDVKVPLLSAESTGHIIATWRGDSGSLSLRFVGGDEMHFAMTVVGQNSPTRTFGEASAQEFFSKNPQASHIVK